jgi:hypothetical protein
MTFAKMYAFWNGGTGAIYDPPPMVAGYVESQMKNLAEAKRILTLSVPEVG